MAAQEGAAAPPVQAKRAALAAALLAQPHGHKCTEHWWAAAYRVLPLICGKAMSLQLTCKPWWHRARLLAHEEAAAAGAAPPMTGELHGGGSATSGARPAVSLFQLYKWATRVAPKSNGPAYLALWLGYARHQGCAVAAPSCMPLPAAAGALHSVVPALERPTKLIVLL